MKFETINGQLCLMTEPVPLTPEAQFPCVVRLIQDDSPMGKLNEYESRRLGRKTIIAVEINENGVVRANDRYFYEHYTRYEILGYPVADGSKEWALQMMRLGKHVIHEGLTPCNIHCDMVTWLDSPESKQYTMQSPDKWLMYCPFKDGWQLYEPKEEHPAINGYNRYDYIPVEGIAMPKPAPLAVKVGDWVEHKESKEQGRITYIKSANYDAIEVKLYDADELETYTVSDFNAEFRKLDPAEVVVDFGSFKGTIELNSHPFNRQITVKGTQGHAIAYINIVYLDTPTRELVRELIKAQEEANGH